MNAAPPPLAQIKLRSLRPRDLENFFWLSRDPAVVFDTICRELSAIPGDELPSSWSVPKFVKEYFEGVRLQSAAEVSVGDVSELHPLDALDLLYRSRTLAMREAWMLNRMSAYVNSRRAFLIAALMGFSKVQDCFTEIHPSNWFGHLIRHLPRNRWQIFDQCGYALSADRSAKKLGDAYFIHAGTNDWNRAWLPGTVWDRRWDIHLANWKELIQRSLKLASKLKADSTQFLIVPEKDTIARAHAPGFFQSGMLPMLLIQELSQSAPPGTVLFPVKELAFTVDPERRLARPDSHLTATDYWRIFELLLQRLGHGARTESPPSFEVTSNPGDLGSKFGATEGERQIVNLHMKAPEVVGGQVELQKPLRDNYIRLENDAAPIRKSLLILGDSHSSTYNNPYLTFVAGHFFGHVEFLWNPFLVHDIDRGRLGLSRYDYVLCETSQRFATPSIE